MIAHPFALASLLALTAGALALPRPSAQPDPFEEARLHLEFNATDDDAEIVLEVDPEVGLSRLRVVNPHGKEVLDLRAKAAENLGIRKVNLETPEPSLAAVLAAYPQGPYRFIGKTVHGETLLSIVWLSHDLPSAAHLTFPLRGQTGVPTSGAAATWDGVPGAKGYFLEIENDDLLVDVKSHVAASQTSFGFPEGWLLPRTEYQIGIAVLAANGNSTVTELDFTTEP